MRLKFPICWLLVLLSVLQVWADYNPLDPEEPGVPITHKSYAFSISCNPKDGGVINSSYAEEYKDGEEILIEVDPAPGYRFVKWEESGLSVSSEPSFKLVMPAHEVALVAHFLYDPTSPNEPSEPEFRESAEVNLSVTPNNAGIVSFEGEEDTTSIFDVGSIINLTAEALTDFNFLYWTEAGEIINYANSFEYEVTEGVHNLIAHFEYAPSSPEEPGDVPDLLPIHLSVKEVGLSLVATAEPAVAQIFYRVDDSAEEIRYTDPIYPTSSANYTFVGRCGGYLDSEPVSIYFDAQLHTLPEFGIEIHDQYLHIILTSLEQTAFFTLDGSDPTLDPEVNPSVYVYDSYNLISLEGWPNETCEVRAVVRQADMFDSPVASRIFHKLPTPELELKGLRVYPHFEEKEWFDENDIPGWFVQIDDEFVYNANDLEDGCIKLEQKDYNFKARVMGNQYIWSDVVELNFVAADHTVSQPVCFPKFDERKIWLGAEYTDGVELQFTVSDSEGNLLQDFATNYEGILDQGNVSVEYISIEADESMKYIQTQAVDKLGERFPSDIITQELNFCEAPVIEYNGVELAFISRDGSFIEMDGEFTNDGLLVFLPELTTYEATAWHPEKFRSRPIDVKIDFNFIPADNRLRVGDPGMVEYAFNYIGLEGLNTLAIEGEIDASDLGFLSRECRELESLSLTDCRFPEGFPALSEMRLTSGEVDLNCLHTLRVGDTASEGSDWLTALPNLAEVYWDSQLPMARNLIRQLDPYVLKRSANGVEDGASDVNVIANDGCETLWVEVGHPFWSSEPFNALRAVAHLNVNQLTPDPKSDGSAGWYSIMLPFDCSGMVDAEKSVPYYPFRSMDQAADDHYRYWLKSADGAAKWRDEARLTAGVPYIIAFPNNTHYPDEVCVAGYVHFIGENVTIRETSYHLSSPVETAWESGMMFAGSWLRGDGESHIGSLLGLNIEQIHTDDEGNNYAPGSVFADRYDVVPLSGYVVDPSGSSRIMRIGGESSDLALPQVSDNFVVEPCGRQFRISASADVEVEVVSATGLRLASYRLMPGEVAETDALLPGVYIIGNRKFILR